MEPSKDRSVSVQAHETGLVMIPIICVTVIVWGYVIKLLSIYHIFNFHNSSIFYMKKLRFWVIKQWASRSLILKGWFSWRTSIIIIWSLLEMQNPGSHTDLLGYNLHFNEILQVVCVHINVREALSGSLWWQVKGATIYIKFYLASELKREAITLLPYVIQISDNGPPY